MQKAKTILCTIALLSAITLDTPAIDKTPADKSIRSSVVKIYCTFQRENYAMPWQSHMPSKGTGTGFIIDKKRILTNAHVVSDARFIQIQKDGDAKRYPAKVTFFGHDCDLAVLKVEDPSFYKDTQPIEFAEQLPELNDEVTVLGYPMGGIRLSITRGVVSRIDYSVYTHSAVDQHLVLQVDAAINPGNSGGPVIFKDKVVGLAFQGLAWGENIGYAIPRPVIRHFLDDIEDKSYNGYPELGAAFLDTRNPALRDNLKLPADKTGVVIYYLDPFGSAKGIIRPRDVLLSIDGYHIANDGTISLDGNNVIFSELLERRQWGKSIAFQVWREGKELQIDIPLVNHIDPFSYRSLYGIRPRYFMIGGLVFSPLSRNYLRVALGGSSSANSHQLTYYSQYAKINELCKGIDEFVVLSRRLPHSVNTYAEGFLNGIVTEINDIKILGLGDIKKAILKPKNGFHVIKFAGMEDSLVLDAKAAENADPDILRSYAIKSPEFMGESK
ncbi:MAG: trypsin-like peptidase domain-containing protein [Kiritimatiellae bacterium]|nr:trypsin-like peptidase domain-containing protein [Kiritimatiellia bacterium]